MKAAADSGCVLVTGAGRGIGLALARQYASAGWHVLATCRSAEAVARLRRLRGQVEIQHLELGDPAGVAGLAERLAGRTIDVLLNVAGVFGPPQDDAAAIHPGVWLHAVRVNAVSPVLLSASLLPCLRRAAHPRVVALGSSLASLARNRTGGAYVYRSSKAALHASMVALAADWRRHGIVVVVIDPGPVRSGMGPRNAPRSPREAAVAIQTVVDHLTPDRSGLFLDSRGRSIPW